MAATGQRPERAYHQDYICRVRFENNLPPPPGSLKMLDIPIDGLDYYASPGFASRLHRSQPINIEADAELGMPIDLVGMPGVFDGDESSIQAPLLIPPVHLKDKNLLRPLSELGKPKYQGGGISFLRRTEYISSDTARARAEAAPKSTPRSPGQRLRKPVDTSKDDPVNVLRAVVKGFDNAHPEHAYAGPDTKDNIKGLGSTPAETEAWDNPKHPARSNLKPLDFYPVLPDLEAVTDAGHYIVTKFTANPTQIIDKRDIRMDVGLLRPGDLSETVYAEYQSKMTAYEADPVNNVHPGAPPVNFHLFLPPDESSAINLSKKLNVDDPDHDDPALYTAQGGEGKGVFQLNHQRVYETWRSTAIDANHAHKEVALALHDPELEERRRGYTLGAKASSSNRSKKAAYYYPIIQKIQLKPHRSKNLAQLGVTARIEDQDDEGKVDAFDVVIEDLDETEKAKRAEHRAELLGEGGETHNGDA